MDAARRCTCWSTTTTWSRRRRRRAAPAAAAGGVPAAGQGRRAARGGGPAVRWGRPGAVRPGAGQAARARRTRAGAQRQPGRGRAGRRRSRPAPAAARARHAGRPAPRVPGACSWPGCRRSRDERAVTARVRGGRPGRARRAGGGTRAARRGCVAELPDRAAGRDDRAPPRCRGRRPSAQRLAGAAAGASGRRPPRSSWCTRPGGARVRACGSTPPRWPAPRSAACRAGRGRGSRSPGPSWTSAFGGTEATLLPAGGIVAPPVAGRWAATGSIVAVARARSPGRPRGRGATGAGGAVAAARRAAAAVAGRVAARCGPRCAPLLGEAVAAAGRAVRRRAGARPGAARRRRGAHARCWPSCVDAAGFAAEVRVAAAAGRRRRARRARPRPAARCCAGRRARAGGRVGCPRRRVPSAAGAAGGARGRWWRRCVGGLARAGTAVATPVWAPPVAAPAGRARPVRLPVDLPAGWEHTGGLPERRRSLLTRVGAPQGSDLIAVERTPLGYDAGAEPERAAAELRAVFDAAVAPGAQLSGYGAAAGRRPAGHGLPAAASRRRRRRVVRRARRRRPAVASAAGTPRRARPRCARRAPPWSARSGGPEQAFAPANRSAEPPRAAPPGCHGRTGRHGSAGTLEEEEGGRDGSRRVRHDDRGDGAGRRSTSSVNDRCRPSWPRCAAGWSRSPARWRGGGRAFTQLMAAGTPTRERSTRRCAASATRSQVAHHLPGAGGRSRRRACPTISAALG